MRVEVVEHDTNDIRLRIGLDDVAHAMREIYLCATFRHQYLTPASLGLADHHQFSNSIALVLDIFSCRASRLYRNGLAHFADQLLGTFVKTHYGPRRIIRSGVQIKHIFHRRDKVRADCGDAPLLYLPRF